MPGFPHIIGIFYVEFDNDKGTKLVYRTPPNLIEDSPPPQKQQQQQQQCSPSMQDSIHMVTTPERLVFNADRSYSLEHTPKAEPATRQTSQVQPITAVAAEHRIFGGSPPSSASILVTGSIPASHAKIGSFIGSGIESMTDPQEPAEQQIVLDATQPSIMEEGIVGEAAAAPEAIEDVSIESASGQSAGPPVNGLASHDGADGPRPADVVDEDAHADPALAEAPILEPTEPTEPAVAEDADEALVDDVVDDDADEACKRSSNNPSAQPVAPHVESESSTADAGPSHAKAERSNARVEQSDAQQIQQPAEGSENERFPSEENEHSSDIRNAPEQSQRPVSARVASAPVDESGLHSGSGAVAPAANDEDHSSHDLKDASPGRISRLRTNSGLHAGFASIDPVDNSHHNPPSMCNSIYGTLSNDGAGTDARSTPKTQRGSSKDYTRPSPPLVDINEIRWCIIPKPKSCNRLINIVTSRYQIMNYPIHIPGPQYERNAFFFNLSFVFERDADTSCYELVVRKLARILRSLEQESLLFSTASTRPIMLKIMEQLHEELNEYHESQISIDASNIINIKVFERFPDPPEVYDFQVPLIVTKLESDKYWDITLQAIFPFINGVNSIKRIAQLSNAKSSLVRLAIRHLIYYGCVKMVDIFQFSNIYIVTPQVRRFMQDVSLRERCRAFVSIPGVATPSDELLLQLLCSFTYDTPVSKLMDSKGSTIASIDIRRFVVFAVVHGLLQRIHTYPILVPKFGESSQNNTKSSSNSNNNNNNNSSSSNSNNHAGKSSIGILDQRRPMTPTAGPPTSALFAGAFAKGTEPWRMIMRTMLTGEHHYDEICTRLDMSVVRLEEELKELGKECTIHKIMKAAPIS